MKKTEILAVLYNYELEDIGRERGLGKLTDREGYIEELAPLITQDEIVGLLPEILSRRSRKRSAGIGKAFLLDRLYNYEIEELAARKGIEIPEGVSDENRDEIIHVISSRFTAPTVKKEFERLIRKRGKKETIPPESVNLIISRAYSTLSGFSGKNTRLLLKQIVENMPEEIEHNGISLPLKEENGTISYGSQTAIVCGYGDMEKEFYLPLIGRAVLLSRNIRFVVVVISEKNGRRVLSSAERGHLQELRIYPVLV